jgi:hypothetical protein
MGVMNDAVEDGVRVGGIADLGVRPLFSKRRSRKLLL